MFKRSLVAITLGLVTLSQAALASHSTDDIVAILSNEEVLQSIGTGEIRSITNLGNRSYRLEYGTCAAEVYVTSLCLPTAPDMPSACTTQVNFSTGSVVCLP